MFELDANDRPATVAAGRTTPTKGRRDGQPFEIRIRWRLALVGWLVGLGAAMFTSPLLSRLIRSDESGREKEREIGLGSGAGGSLSKGGGGSIPFT